MKRQASRHPLLRLGGFSLIEEAVAVGIVGFAMISVLGLLPMGLATFKQARNNTVESEIVQALLSEIEVTSFANIPQMTATYSFNTEGNLITTASASNPAIYTAQLSYQTVSTTASSGTVFPINLNSTSSPEAYNVQIQIKNIAQPNQPHIYSVIVANKNY